MPRPERPIDPSSGPIAAFAAELRELRTQAGSPKYLQMARRTGRSRTALAEAAGGDHLPTWETVEAYVLACDGDPRQWLATWERTRDRTRASALIEPPAASTTRSSRLRALLPLVVVGPAMFVLGAYLPLSSGSHRQADASAQERAISVGGRSAVLIGVSRFAPFAAGDLATAGAGGVVQVWTAGTGLRQVGLDTHDPQVTCLAFDPLNRNVLATGGTSGVLRLWDTEAGRPVLSLPAQPPGRPLRIAFDPRRRGVLATAGAGGTVMLWDWGRNVRLGEIRTGDREVTALTFDPQNKGVLATAGPTYVRVWDTTSDRLLATVRGVHGAPRDIQFDPLTLNTLAVVGADGGLGIWDASNGRPVRTMRTAAKVTTVAFNPLIRNSLASGDDRGGVQIWDSSNALLVHSLSGPAGPVTALEYTTDGQRLAAGAADGQVHLSPIEDW